MGAHWLSGRLLDSRLQASPASLARHINPCLVLVQPRKTSADLTEKLLSGT